MRPRKNKPGSILAGRKLRLLAVLLLYLLWNGAAICAYSVRDERRPADAVIVLGAAASDSGVSPVYRARLDHGIDLYRQGFAGTLIVTGGRAEGNRQSDAYRACEYAVSQGVPAADVLLEDTSRITQENLENAKALMEASGMETALIVSDPLHMKRAMLLAEDAGLCAYSSPTPMTMYRSLRTKLPFLAREMFYYIGYKWYRVFF